MRETAFFTAPSRRHAVTRRARLSAVLLGAVVTLTACSVGPAYHRPDVPLPSAWQTQAPSQQAQWPSSDWWRGFGSSTLNDYVQQALSQSDDIAAAVARVREADAQARIAGAPLFPAVGVSGEALRQRAFNGSGVQPAYNEFTPVVSASYALDFWGKYRAQHQAALLTALASRYDRQTVVLTVLSGVASNYFEALEMRDRLKVAENDVANAQHILDGLELEQQVGTVTALDVAQQAAVVAVENATIPPLQQQLRQSMNELALLLGRTPESLAFQDASLARIAPPPVVAGLPSQLLRRRPDIAEAEANLHSANANITVARANFFPNVTLTGAAGFASTALDSVVNPANRLFSVSGTLTQDIFEGGALRGQLQYSWARYAELLSDYHLTVLTALDDVENALIAVQQTEDQQRRQQQAADAAQKAFDYAQRQMTAGVVSILTVLNTETTLFTAQDQLVQVQFAHLQALVQLYQALGGGWQQGQQATL